MLQACVFESDLEVPSGVNLIATYDWSLTGSHAAPASMALAVFADGAQPVQVSSTGAYSSRVSLIPNTYKLIAFNDDGEALFSRGQTWDTFEIYAQPTELSRVTRMFQGTRAIPMARGTEDETVVLEPDELWTAALGETTVTADSLQTVNMQLQSAIIDYRFTIKNVENLDHAADFIATISGMSGSWFPASRKASSTRCVIPFQLSSDGSSLQGVVRTFGVSRDESQSTDTVQNKLTIYAEMQDGSKVYFVSDVTEAIRKAGEPGSGETSEVTIVIEDLPLPKPINKGGMELSVGEWTEVQVVVPM